MLTALKIQRTKQCGLEVFEVHFNGTVLHVFLSLQQARTKLLQLTRKTAIRD